MATERAEYRVLVLASTVASGQSVVSRDLWAQNSLHKIPSDGGPLDAFGNPNHVYAVLEKAKCMESAKGFKQQVVFTLKSEVKLNPEKKCCECEHFKKFGENCPILVNNKELHSQQGSL